MKIVFVFLDSSRVSESFAVFSFVFEVKIDILSKISVKNWGHGPPCPPGSYAYGKDKLTFIWLSKSEQAQPVA